MRIGVDIGGSHIATGIVKQNGELIGKETKDINVLNIKTEKRIQELIIETIKNQIDTLLKRYEYSIDDIYKIGIAVPGTPVGGCISNVVNLHIKRFNIAKELSAIYKTKLYLKNDGKCAGIAEKKFGALQKYDDCIFLCIGTGVGTCVFLGGELLEPKQAPGFELGHLIMDSNGEKCNCGNIGCFETFASMKRFKKKAIEQLKLPEDFQSEELQNYIRTNKDKPKVKKLISNYLEDMSIGIANIINIFEPEAICFGGSFSYYDDIFLKELNERIQNKKFNENTKCKLISAKLKNDAGIIGATTIEKE